MSTTNPMTQGQLDAIRARVDSVEFPDDEHLTVMDGEEPVLAWVERSHRDGSIISGAPVATVHAGPRAARMFVHAPQDLTDLLAEVERLRARLTVDDAMVERMAEAIYLRCFLRCSTWATEARAKASLEAAKAGYIGYIDGWKAACEDARAALDALDTVVSAPEHAHQTKEHTS